METEFAKSHEIYQAGIVSLNKSGQSETSHKFRTIVKQRY